MEGVDGNGVGWDWVVWEVGMGSWDCSSCLGGDGMGGEWMGVVELFA